MSDTKLNKEQDLDAWTLLQKDVDLLRSRQAKRNSRRREKPKKKAVQRNGLFFMTVPKLRRKPLDLQIPSIDACNNALCCNSPQTPYPDLDSLTWELVVRSKRSHPEQAVGGRPVDLRQNQILRQWKKWEKDRWNGGRT